MNQNKEDLLPLVTYYANKYKIPVRFLAALVQTESNWNKNICRYEPGYIWVYSVKEMAEILGITRSTVEVIQKTSWGLCQIIGAVFHEAKLYELPAVFCEPDINLKYGCEHLLKIMKRNKLEFAEPLDVYSAYNAGSIRYDMEGRYVNSANVTNFKKNYQLLSDLI